MHCHTSGKKVKRGVDGQHGHRPLRVVGRGSHRGENAVHHDDQWLVEAVRIQIIVDAVVDICKCSCRRARRMVFHEALVVSQGVDSGFHDIEQHLSMTKHFRNTQEQSNCMVTTVT